MSVSLVQKASGSSGTAVFASANTAGNLLVCAVRGGSSCSVADPSNGTWTKATAAAAAYALGTTYVSAIAGNSVTITHPATAGLTYHVVATMN